MKVKFYQGEIFLSNAISIGLFTFLNIKFRNMQLTNVSAEIMIKVVYIPEAYLEHSQTSTMEFSPKIVDGL